MRAATCALSSRIGSVPAVAGILAGLKPAVVALVVAGAGIGTSFVAFGRSNLKPLPAVDERQIAKPFQKALMLPEDERE